MIQIKSIGGRVLYTAETATDVRQAVTEAVAQRADLQGAYLQGAYLQGAYLQRAYLQGAYLQGAYGLAPERVTPLLMLLDQPGPIRAYKLVNADSEGIYNGGLKYKIGKTVEVSNANADPNTACAAGINLATLDWCLVEWAPGHRILICEFEAKDIAAIPTATDGKFRVRRCKVVAEKEIDPVALGLVREEEQAA